MDIQLGRREYAERTIYCQKALFAWDPSFERRCAKIAPRTPFSNHSQRWLALRANAVHQPYPEDQCDTDDRSQQYAHN